MRIIKYFLWPFSLIYGFVTSVRNWLYDSKKWRSASFNIPTISVGNLNTGGSGKTPHIEYLIELFLDKYKIATLSRGYGRKTTGFIIADPTSTAREIGDEPAQLNKKYPSIVVTVGENRLLAIPQLLQKHPDIDVILLDDAFQHRPVQPGLNILLTTYDKPYFDDYVLPMGRLREFSIGRKRADIIIVTKCPEKISIEERDNFIKKLKHFPHQTVFFTRINYGDFYLSSHKDQSFTLDPNKKCIILTGIAHPHYLHHFLSQKNINFTPIQYNDHYIYKRTDIDHIIAQCQQNASDQIITTEKDYVRLESFADLFTAADIKLIIAPIKMDILQNDNLFNEKVSQYINSTLQHSENFIQRI